jgi:CheY-like chemotaxis protein
MVENRLKDAPKQDVILVIEDEDLLRQVVMHKLRKAGYFVMESASGDDALKQLQNHSKPIDLVLTDIIKPKMNGREVVAEIRRMRPTIAVLYMSGYPSDIVANRGELEPGIDFLEKAEVIGDGLIHKIREILNRSTST